MDPAVVRLITLGREVIGRRAQAAGDPPHRPVAAPGPDPRRPRRPAVPDDGRRAVAGGPADRPPIAPDRRCGYHSPDMTAVFNLVSPCPAISVPCGRHRATPDAGLPIGLQVVGRRWREDIVLRIARAVELTSAARPSRRRQPAPAHASRASSSSGVAAATGVRRASWSSTVSSRPRASTTTAPASRQISVAGEVVPHAVGVGAHVDEGVERAGGDEAQVERHRAEGAELRPAVAAARQPADADDRPRRLDAARTARAARRLATPPRRARR